MKKILYLIPLFLLFLIPKAYALPDCTLVSNATLYDVNSATSVSSISTNKDSELLCNTIHSAYGTSDSSHGLGWSIDLSSLNNGNSYYQLDVFMYASNDSGSVSIISSSFRNNFIAIGTSNPSTLWANGTTNISDFNYSYSYYYDINYGRTYKVVSYIFKANTNFNKIFVPFATSNLWSGYFDLIGINLTNTGQSSLTDTEINNLLNEQTNNLKSEINNNINNSETNINNNINEMEESINNTINDNFNSCRDSVNLFNKNSSYDYPVDNFTNKTTLLSNGNIQTTANFSAWSSRGVRLYFEKNTNYTLSGNLLSSTGTGQNTIAELVVYGFNGSTWLSVGRISYKNVGYSKITFNTSNYQDFFLSFNTNGTIGQSFVAVFNNVQIEKGSSATSYEEYGEKICNNKIDETNDKLNDVNNSINDLNGSINDSNSSGATNSAGNFFNNFEDNDFGLSGIITAPLNTIKSITSNACTPINLTIPFVNKNMSLPCMTDIYEEHFGSFLNIYQIITFGMISYWVCVQIYAMVKGFKNPDKDEIEVMDL